MKVLRVLRMAFAALPAVGGHATINLGTRRRTRRTGRSAVLTFVVVVLASHAATYLALEDARIRDPEYGRRATRLTARVAENPGRPLVLFVGSSRTAMGVNPAVWEAARPGNANDPLLFNAAVLGAGPVMELMTLRRLYADGFRPAVVLIEYWPPFLHYGGEWAEPNRVATDRLTTSDWEAARGYFPDIAKTDAAFRRLRTSPIHANRERILGQLLPTWLPPKRRIDWAWDTLDPWGWKPGFDFAPGPSPERTAMLKTCSDTYKPLFAQYAISPVADRALRDVVAMARQHGSEVGFVYLPESSEFRGIYGLKAETEARNHLSGLSKELAVRVIDAREWADDGHLVDGFHLSRIGSAAFTRKLGIAVTEAFPETGVKP